MSSRRKPNNVFPVKDETAANGALGEIAMVKRAIEGINGRLNDEIDRLKAEAKAEAAPFEARLTGLENGLSAYAEYNRDTLFDDKRSRNYLYGSLGYRKSTEVKPVAKQTLGGVLGKCKELGFDEAVRVKESLNKDELHTWSDERLGLVGACRVVKDTFWYEIDEQAVEAA